MLHYSFSVFSILLAVVLDESIFTNANTAAEIYGDSIMNRVVVYDSGPFGSNYRGEWFTDFWQSLDGRRVKPQHWPDQINIRAGGRIDAIQVNYGPYKARWHGGEGGELHRIRLYDGDKVVRVSGRRGIGPGAGVDQLTFYTKSGEKYGPYGGTGGLHFEARPPEHSCYLACISGRADLRLDSITFHWRCPQSPHLISEPRIGYSGSTALKPTCFVPLLVLAVIFKYYG